MTSLTGSEKQVKWANDIRSNVMQDVDALIAHAEVIFPEAKLDFALGIVKKIKALLDDKTHASWWIDNKKSYVPVRVPLNRDDIVESNEFGFRTTNSETKDYKSGLTAACMRLAADYENGFFD